MEGEMKRLFSFLRNLFPKRLNPEKWTLLQSHLIVINSKKKYTSR